MLKTKLAVPNKIKEICETRGVSVRKLAKLADISSSQLDRIVSGKEPPTIKQTMSICGALNVNSYEIFDLKFEKKLTNDLDDVLLGSATVWLLEAARDYKLELNKADCAKWVSFIYKETVARSLNGQAVRDLAATVVKILELVKRKT